MLMTAMKNREVELKPCKSLDFFKGLILFATLADEEVAKFTNASLLKTSKKGQLLYEEGEPADFFYIICSGWLKLFYTTEDGDEVSLAMLTRSSMTGENAIFEQDRFTCSAQVVEAANILKVPLSLLKERLRANNHLAFNMMTSMVQYQRRHELQLEQFLLYSAPQRIGCFLLGLCPTLEQKDGVTLQLPYDKTLIASTLGMKGATFSRALNILRDETGIHIAGTRVTIESMERLLIFVDGCYSRMPLRGVELAKDGF